MSAPADRRPAAGREGSDGQAPASTGITVTRGAPRAPRRAATQALGRALLLGWSAWGGWGAWSRAAQAAVGTASGGRPRIVSVGAAITETLYALGAEADLVGVDTSSLWPVEATRLPQVGYQRTLSPEGVLALRPTLVLATEAAGPPAVLQQLREAGIVLQVLDADHRIDGVLARTRQVAEACGRPEAGRRLAARIDADWQAAQTWIRARAPAPARAPRVLFVLAQGTAGLRAAGRGTAPDALLAQAGARNVLATIEGYQAVSAEAMVVAAPEVIVCTTHTWQALGGREGLLAQAGLARTPAGRAGRVVALDTLLALGFGPRLPQALRTLGEALYGPGGGRA